MWLRGWRLGKPGRKGQGRDWRALHPLSTRSPTPHPPPTPTHTQNLPPVLFTLMKSTEPHTDSYYQHDIEAGMRAAGLVGVVTRESDPRHRVVLGFLPHDA